MRRFVELLLVNIAIWVICDKISLQKFLCHTVSFSSNTFKLAFRSNEARIQDQDDTQ